MTSQPSPPPPPPRRKHRLRGILAPLFMVLLVLVGGLGWVSWIPVQRAREHWRHGRTAEAIEEAKQWSRLRIWPAAYHQILAVSYLTVNRAAEAKPHLAALSSGRVWMRAFDKAEVAKRLFARGRYREFLDYDAASKEMFRKDEAALYRAAALMSINRLTDAEAALKDVDDSRRATLEQQIAQRKNGSYPLVTDRNGKIVALYQIANSDLVALNVHFAPIVEKEAGPFTIESHLAQLGAQDTIQLTLDADVQKAAIDALGGFRGALVAIDPTTNELLAVASNRGNGSLADLALGQQYEPGSVIKVVTGLNAFASGVDVKSMFPYNCPGHLVIDGRQFGDWLQGGHGQIPSFEEAMARSCNVFFADLGLRLGLPKLRELMTKAGFDGSANLTLFQVPLGKTIPPIFNKFETAFYAIGIEHESSSALQLAMIAAAIANHGTMTTPRLLRARHSILGEEMPDNSARLSVQLAPRPATEAVMRAMRQVVTSPNGTGRRAALPGVSIAMKTGTAGKEDEGQVHAAIIGFAPSENAKIAYAIIAEDAGPAEFAGAKIAHDFMSAIASRLR